MLKGRELTSFADFHPPFYVGADVGGTSINCGIVDDSGSTLLRVSRPTNASLGPEVGLSNIRNVINEAVALSPISWDEVVSIGLATPGTMDIPAGRLLDPANLPGWRDVPIRDLISQMLEKPTFLQNDANAAAYGEYWVGAAQAAHSLVFWTLGTGIGCGIIIGDMIIRGEHSHGSECGHIIIEMDHGRPCDTGQYGTLEAYASAKSLVRRCREALETNHRDSSLRHIVASGKEITPVAIARAAEAGDRLADDLIMDTARYLGAGTTTLLHTIDPNMVLFGGAMTFGRNHTKLGRRFLARIRDEVRQRAFPVPYERTTIDYATLGANAGYIGAAGYARKKTAELASLAVS